ncbi:MAG: sensor histidine kinase, partial [Actinobacteria bacterium]|nr:sensor histidine kinase [Actinomycetota bacterium]
IPEPGRLRGALAKTLRDPSVEIGYWSRDQNGYVDTDGRSIDHLAQSPDRSHTTIEHDGQPLAIIVHDSSLSEEREVLEAAIAAARLALVNERLQAEVRAQLQEVQASRARIIEATDAERRRLERDLHDGAQQRLVSLNLALRMLQRKASSPDPRGLPEDLGQAAEELRQAINELRDLAQGIHPPTLTEKGLAVALDSLAERAPFPVEIVSVPEGRFSPVVEATMYFAVTEALTNSAKHAHATHAQVTITRADGALRGVITDDGVGGADMSRGTGLLGLLDRVSGAAGELRLTSPKGAGTRMEVNLPCG